MTTMRNIIVVVSILSALTSCKTEIKVDEKDKIFHAGPANSGFGAIYWELYKDNKYQFCDGDFMDYGCYTGLYSISGDTVTLHDLKSIMVFRQINSLLEDTATWIAIIGHGSILSTKLTGKHYDTVTQ